MEKKYDVLIVGAGYAGAVAARALAEGGKRVLLWERRDHVGGNAYDCVDPTSSIPTTSGSTTGCLSSPGGGTISTGWWPTFPTTGAAA